MGSDYWNSYYAKSNKNTEPSQFARFVASRFPDRLNIIDVGCGNGRDSFFFASQGHCVIGVDASENAIEVCNLHGEPYRDRCQFSKFDVGREDLAKFLLGRRFAPDESLIYARFFLHAISQETEEQFLAAIAGLIDRGARLCLEFRTIDDVGTYKVELDHFRRFIDPGVVESRCVELGMRPEFYCCGNGLALYGDEDPVVARMILKGGRP